MKGVIFEGFHWQSQRVLSDDVLADKDPNFAHGNFRN
jgi:hypothetical protein